MIRSKLFLRISDLAMGSFIAVMASYPACPNQSFCICDRPMLSSTINIFRFIRQLFYLVLRLSDKDGDGVYYFLDMTVQLAVIVIFFF